MLVPNLVYNWFQRPEKWTYLNFDIGFGYGNQESHPSLHFFHMVKKVDKTAQKTSVLYVVPIF